MGIVPVWGFQLIIAIALSIYFKLNKGLVILSANISLPPLIPVILFLSHYVGGFWFGENAVTFSFEKGLTLEFFSESLLQYIMGGVTLAVFAGLSFGGFSYLMMKAVKKKSG